MVFQKVWLIVALHSNHTSWSPLWRIYIPLVPTNFPATRMVSMPLPSNGLGLERVPLHYCELFIATRDMVWLCSVTLCSLDWCFKLIRYILGVMISVGMSATTWIYPSYHSWEANYHYIILNLGVTDDSSLCRFVTSGEKWSISWPVKWRLLTFASL